MPTICSAVFWTSELSYAAVLMHGRTTTCRVGSSAGAVFLCILVAIKIPSGGATQSGYC
jgi:hypothetical protein